MRQPIWHQTLLLRLTWKGVSVVVNVVVAVISKRPTHLASTSDSLNSTFPVLLPCTLCHTFSCYSREVCTLKLESLQANTSLIYLDVSKSITRPCQVLDFGFLPLLQVEERLQDLPPENSRHRTPPTTSRATPPSQIRDRTPPATPHTTPSATPPSHTRKQAPPVTTPPRPHKPHQRHPKN